MNEEKNQENKVIEQKFTVKLATCISKKNNTRYVVAYIDLGYRKVFVSFDKNTIAELFNIPVAEVYRLIEN